MKKTKLFFIIPFLLVAFSVFGANIKDDKLRVGKPGSVLDKTIELGTTQKIRANQTSGKLEFSNDGSNFTDIGSGSGGGGGTSLLTDLNGDFEASDPPDNWTKTGAATFVAETVNPLFGTQSGKVDFSAASENLDSNLVAIEQGFIGQKCQAEIHYRWPAGVSGDIKLQALNQTSTVLAEVDLDGTVSNDTRKSQLFFDCPSLGDSMRMRLTSTADAAELTVDSAFIGTGKNTFQLSQTSLVAEVKYVSTGGCIWTNTGSAFDDFGTIAACPSISVDFSSIAVDTTDNDLPDVDFNDLPSGTYRIESRVPIASGTATTQIALRLSDGSSSGAPCGVRTGNGDTDTIHEVFCSAVFTYSSGGPRNFKLQGRAGTNSITIQNALGDQQELNFTVWRVPTSPAEAITLESIGDHWDVNIGGANSTLGTAAVTSFAHFGDASLDMVINPGSRPAEIPCASNPSTGITCAVGIEIVGIVIDVKTKGRYKVCGEFGVFQDSASNSQVETIFQWIETNNADQTLVQLGNSRVPVSNSQGVTGGDDFETTPLNLCGHFTFNPGQHTLKVMYEQTVAGTVNSVLLLADRGALKGDRDIHITVEQSDKAAGTPAFTDLTDSLLKKVGNLDDGVNQNVLFSAAIGSTATTPVVVRERGGNWLTSVTKSGTGAYSANFETGTFSSEAPQCFAMAGSPDRCFRTSCANTSCGVNATVCSTAVAIDHDFQLLCHGKSN